MLSASLKHGSLASYSSPLRKFVWSAPRFMSKSKSNVLVRMGKSKNRGKYFLEYDDLDFSLDAARSPSSFGSSFDDSYMEKVFKPVVVKARNPRQHIYLNELENEKTDIILAVGPAGTGKTMLPCHIGIRKLQSNEISKLVITRPAVSVEEQHGFLPGTLEEKMEPWLRPMMDVFQQYYSPMKIQKMIQQQIIEVSPLAYMRGRTFENSWIIADESQNMTPNQMLMLLTRIGNNSKMIITGDQKQHDRGFEKNGLTDFLNRLKSSDKVIPEIQLIEFLDEDVERHKVIPKILRLYQ